MGAPLLLLLLLLNGPLVAAATDDAATPARELRMGVLAYRDQWSTLARWQPTAAYLSQEISGYLFSFVTFDHAGLQKALSQGELDFVLTPSSHYIELKARYGLVPVANLVNQYQGQPLTQYGAAIFTRADRPGIESIADLRGRKFAAAGPEAFGGFQMAWLELLRHGIDPFHNFESLYLTGLPHDQVVLAVRDGLVDAGTARAGVLERMAEDGKVRLDQFRVLNARHNDGFPFLHSTDLYPEWPLARAAHTSETLGKAVAKALFALEPDSVPTRRARIAGWTVPLDYGPARDLLRTLRLGPYADEPGDSLGHAGILLWVIGGLSLPAVVLAWIVSQRRRARRSNRQYR